MKPKTFIDTNILIYAIDRYDLEKQRSSRKRLTVIEKEGNGVVSTQVIQEFFVAATKKLGMDPRVAKQQIDGLANFEVVDVDVPLIKDAVDCSILSQIHFWDALIVVSAQKAKCDVLLTEDLNHGQLFKTLKIENLFI